MEDIFGSVLGRVGVGMVVVMSWVDIVERGRCVGGVVCGYVA